MAKKGGSDKQAEQARADEQARQERIRQGTSQINDTFNSQFNDDFFGRRQQGYLDYATPQLQDQFGKAKEQLTYALARGGNTDSSLAAQKQAELQQAYDLNRQQVADQALSYGTQARNSVEDARSGLVQMLNASGDAQGAATAAITRAQALSQPQQYSPLGQLFGQFTSGLGAQAAAEKSAYISGTSPTYNTGLFTPKNAISVSGN
jgi:hypothetical protein